MIQFKTPEKPLFTNKMLRRLILPLVVEQALALTVGMVDTMMISTVGEAAVSGVSLVDMIAVFIINLFAALATGGAVVISQYFGAKDPQKARDSASQLILLSTLLGILIAVLCYIFAPFIMAHLFGTLDADVYQAGLLYLRVSAFSFPFLALYNAGAAIFRSANNAKVSMHVSVVMNLINVTGNAFCIFVLKWGVLGVAVPSVVSRMVAAVMILYLCMKHDSVVPVAIPRRIELPLARRILSIGVPSALENSLFQAGRILVVSFIATYGTAQITANAVANNLASVACIPGSAVALAVITVVGRSIGANDPSQAIYYTRKLMCWIFFISAGANILVVLGAPLLLSLYTLSEETYALAYQLICIHSIPATLFWTFSFVLPNALRAANDVRFTMVVSIISMWTCRILCGYIFCIQLGLGAVGIFYAMLIDWVARSTCFLLRFLSGKWKEKYVADTAA